MRSIPVNDLVDFLKQFVELVPYGAVAGRIRREGVGEGEKGQEQFMGEGKEAGRGWCLLVFGGRYCGNFVKGAEGAVFARCWGRWRYEVPYLGW